MVQYLVSVNMLPDGYLVFVFALNELRLEEIDLPRLARLVLDL